MFYKLIRFIFTPMKAGRPSEHAFNSLEVGQKAQLKGKAKDWPHQFIYQYGKNRVRKLKLIREGKKVFVERVK